jgi:hypothetical protein
MVSRSVILEWFKVEQNSPRLEVELKEPIREVSLANTGNGRPHAFIHLLFAPQNQLYFYRLW